jgi:hypothetical protein
MTIEKYTIQLQEFLSIYNKYDDSKLTIVFNGENNSFSVYFSIPSLSSIFHLVTQKNATRTFKNMKSLVNCLSIEESTSYEITFS